MAFNKYFKSNSGSWQSDCGKTLAGWYVDNGNGEKACFKAFKQNSNDADMGVA